MGSDLLSVIATNVERGELICQRSESQCQYWGQPEGLLGSQLVGDSDVHNAVICVCTSGICKEEVTCACQDVVPVYQELRQWPLPT